MFEIKLKKIHSYYARNASINSSSEKEWVCPHNGCEVGHTTLYSNQTHCSTCGRSMPKVMDLLNSKYYRLKFHRAEKGNYRV